MTSVTLDKKSVSYVILAYEALKAPAGQKAAVHCAEAIATRLFADQEAHQ